MKHVIASLRILLLLLLAAPLCACFSVSRVGKPLNLDDLLRSPINTVGERFLSPMPESQVPFYLLEPYRSENLVRASQERTLAVHFPNYLDAVNKIIFTPSGDLRAITVNNTTYLIRMVRIVDADKFFVAEISSFNFNRSRYDSIVTFCELPSAQRLRCIHPAKVGGIAQRAYASALRSALAANKKYIEIGKHILVFTNPDANGQFGDTVMVISGRHQKEILYPIAQRLLGASSAEDLVTINLPL